MADSLALSFPERRDARRAARKRVLISGKVANEDGSDSLNCTIHDISATGARISIPKGQSLSGTVYLIDPKNRIAYAARLVRQQESICGIQFVANYPLSRPLEPQLEFLRRLWYECAVR